MDFVTFVHSHPAATCWIVLAIIAVALIDTWKHGND